MATISVSGSIVRSKNFSCAIAPVVDRLESLALVARELDVDLRRRHDACVRHLDDRERFLVEAVEHEPVARAGDGLAFRRVLLREPSRRRLLAGEDRGDELPSQLRPRIAEPERRIVAHASSASIRPELRCGGSCST